MTRTFDIGLIGYGLSVHIFQIPLFHPSFNLKMVLRTKPTKGDEVIINDGKKTLFIKPLIENVNEPQTNFPSNQDANDPKTYRHWPEFKKVHFPFRCSCLTNLLLRTSMNYK